MKENDEGEVVGWERFNNDPIVCVQSLTHTTNEKNKVQKLHWL